MAASGRVLLVSRHRRRRQPARVLALALALDFPAVESRPHSNGSLVAAGSGLAGQPDIGKPAEIAQHCESA